MEFLNNVKNTYKKVVSYSLPILLAGSINTYAQKPNLKNAAILDFENKSVASQNVEDISYLISSSLGMKLRDHLNIVEKQDLEKILKENNEDSLKNIAPNLINEGINYIIIGNYSVVSNDELIINSKLINLRNLDNIETQYIDGSIKDGIRGEINYLVNELIQDLHYSAYMASKREPNKRVPEPTSSLEQVREIKTNIEAHLGRTYFGGLANLASPMTPENFKEYWNNSIAFGIRFGKVSNSSIGFVIPKIGYNVFDLNMEGVEGGEISVFNIGGDVVLRFVEKGQVIPFANIGVGYYNVKFGDVRTDYGPESGESQDKIGYDIGLGLDFYVGDSYFLTLGMQYNHIETDEKAMGFSSLYGGINFIFGDKK